MFPTRGDLEHEWRAIEHLKVDSTVGIEIKSTHSDDVGTKVKGQQGMHLFLISLRSSTLVHFSISIDIARL